MPEATGYPAGTPSWVELASTDVAASRAFYGGLLGWSSYTLTVDRLDDYEVFTLGGVQGPEVAGMQFLVDDSQPSSWTCYFRTDDLPATIAAVRAAGGQDLVEPTDVANLGRMAVCCDTQGASFALWVPYDMPGAGAVNVPSAMCWVELACTDLQGSRRFYGSVFGWTAVQDDPGRSSAVDWYLGDRPVVGMVAMEEFWSTGYPAAWIPYFQVTDCDAAAARAAELGARILVSPTESTRPGRFSVMIDPLGACLAVVTP